CYYSHYISHIHLYIQYIPTLRSSDLIETLKLGFSDESDEGRFNNISEPDFLSRKISYLTNEFRFSSVQSINISDKDWSSVIEDHIGREHVLNPFKFPYHMPASFFIKK